MFGDDAICNAPSLEFLQYMHENGCLWHIDMIQIALRKNRNYCVQYAIANGCPWDKNKVSVVKGLHFQYVSLTGNTMYI